MPIRVCWEFAVRQFKTLSRELKTLPRGAAHRRRNLSRFSAEAFEPRRLLSAFVVNSLADTHDAIPGDGIAADVSGLTTLRAALEEANALIGADTIQLPAGTINMPAGSGPFVISEDLTIVGAGNSQTLIDGSAFDQVFQFSGSASLQLSDVSVRTARDLALNIRPTLLTSNLRQADLVVAFSLPSTPLAIETKTPNGLSALVGVVPAESFFELRAKPIDRIARVFDPNDISVRPESNGIPTPDAPIEEIVNALFQGESIDFVLPASRQKLMPPTVPEAPVSTGDQPSRMVDDNEVPERESTPDGMMSDFDTDERSMLPVEDKAVQAVLRGWADEAGWNEYDFLTSGVRTAVVSRPTSGKRVAALAVVALSGVSTEMWTRSSRWLRESVSPTSWRQRLDRLRRRPR